MTELSKYSLESLKEGGLTPEEALILSKWVDDGKVGVTKLKAESFGKLYALGYSCQDIHHNFPEYPLSLLLYARVMYKWDEERSSYRRSIQENIAEAAINARAESIKFLTEIAGATHEKWRKEIMEYVANPSKEKAPDCLPNSLTQYGNLMKLLQEIVNPSSTSKKTGSESDMSKTTPLVSIQVNNKEGASVNITQSDVKDALIKDVTPKP